jgi:hypothetical protein
MRRYRGVLPTFTCDLCVHNAKHFGPHRTLVNAAATAMFWGTHETMFEIVRAADVSDGPGLIEVGDEHMAVFLWLYKPHEAAIAKRFWSTVLDAALEWKPRRSTL